MITLDTSALLTAIDRTDPDHERVLRALALARGPYILPVSILSEATYVIEGSLGGRMLVNFIRDLALGKFSLDCGAEDLDRVLALVSRYADLPLGFADAAVIACAERNGGLVASLDYRHFGVVAGEGTIQILPNS